MKCTEFNLKFIAAMLICIMSPLWAFSQTITVSGTVVDELGEPLIGATVQQKGTSNGTSTDIDGNYTLSVSPKATITVSYVGYNTQNIEVNGRNVINVTMQENSAVLDEVVVVGYGQMKRSDLTGSVVSVGEDAVKKSISTSIDQVLQGRAAGVQIQANSGTPGASTSIRIRGINSLNATNQPIFVIDGVVIDSATDDESSNPLASINPSDIVSMDVLKDASATAIYGSRASNGVIMITTKRGKAGEATVTYDVYLGWQEMPKKYDMLNLREYAEHHNFRADYLSSVDKNNAFIRPELLGEGTDWQDELFRKAFMMNHNVSVTGGNERTTWAFSGGYLDQDGIALGSGFKRYTLRSNLETQIKSWLRGGVNFSLTDSKQQVGTDNNTIISALIQQPTVAVTAPDGSFDGPDDVWMPDNPVGLASIITNKNKKLNFRLNAFLEATLYKGLTLRTELSGDYNLNKYYFYEPDYQFGIKTQDQRTSRWTKTDTKYWSWRNILTYNNTFARKHNVNVMLGQEMSKSYWENQVGATTGFLSNSTPDLSAGDISKSTSTGSRNINSIASFFGRAFYSFDERYLLTATIRRDGSSKFAKGHKWGWFPAVALAWRVSQENFLRDVDEINSLKLRAGWGKTGNQNVTDYAYMALLANKTTPWGVGVLTGNTANPDLTWETTSSYNIGLDLGLLQNRIEFIADVYYKKTDNLLLQLPLPSFLGSGGHGAANNPWGNVGSIENKGIELTLNTTNIVTRDFQWTSNVVFSLNRNKVKSLDTANSSIEKSYQPSSTNYIVTKTVVGEPIGQFWGYKVIGRFDKPEDFYYHDAAGNIQQVAIPSGNTISQSSTWIGDYIYEDINGDGVIDSSDCTFIGNPEPKFTWGFGNTFTWKGIDLNIFFSGSYGNDALNLTRMRIEDPRQNSNILRSSLNYAKVDVIDPNLPADDFRNLHVVNPGSTTMPALQRTDANANYTRVSDLLVEDASYIRLQNISIGYTFPRNWMRKIYLQNLRVYFSAQNVYTWSKYKGLDPEVGAMYGDALMTGVDYGRYPSPRIYTFGLNVSF
ncbi:TonB-dependent receptor [Barnesiella sp. WM24]|uniref:SusC/RagA family TonB-linked outer membrane protein n=1 Tax=Barnesiella sp. WM24 TaxID=2558278 RepID=UPI000B21BA7B|nr:TonB-dependent receptor [Barnesiella sp. WM24]TFU94843.1 TonB-dependent receptor [Barnesiella sp. WM24]